MKKQIFEAFTVCGLALAGLAAKAESVSHLAPVQSPARGSVIFIHPDGTSASHWTAARMMIAGPDGTINWDRLPYLAVYRGHMKSVLAATSHGGATTHSYGKKVHSNSYGMDRDQPLSALSGKPMSIMQEALASGFAAGTINSGNIDEPGTGVFLSSSESRKDGANIAKQIVLSGADVIMGGGEKWLLPEGVEGRHGKGARTDGLNLVEEAVKRGYTLVYTRGELKTLPGDAKRVLGIFAHHHTFNDKTEEELREDGLPLYKPGAPDVGEMAEAALRVLSSNGKPFLLVVEEEGTDNFSNMNNAPGTVEALRRADRAYGAALDYLKNDPDTLVLTAADSDAGGLEVIAAPMDYATKPTPAKTANGAPLDGAEGTGTLPFIAQPDQFGKRMPFGIAWSGTEDGAGGIIVRAAGINAEALSSGSCDNTDIYRLMYMTLFGRDPSSAKTHCKPDFQLYGSNVKEQRQE